MIPKECKRLAEVDFPIAEVSRHAAREKSIRHGHPSTLHLWWARRPLASSRAVLLALLLPDPCDPHCPDDFKSSARESLRQLRAAPSGWTRDVETDEGLRRVLLRFIADFANWDNAADPDHVEAGRALVRAAHPDEPPLVVDPFAGGGSIPLEALRLGCDAFASDLNPVACLILKVMLEDIPRHGPGLADELRKAGAEIKARAEKELADLYPRDPDGATPIAYLWARTVRCEAPNCGAEIPLMRSFWLCKKPKRKTALRPSIVPVNGAVPRVEFQIFEPQTDSQVTGGTVARARATCLCCGAVVPPERVRAQLAAQRGGADVIFDEDGNRTGGAMMTAVVTLRPSERGRHYRLPTAADYAAVAAAQARIAAILNEWERDGRQGLCPVPNEPTPVGGGSGAGRAFSVQKYGMLQWGDLFTARQKAALIELTHAIRNCGSHVNGMSLALGKLADLSNAICLWEPVAECPRQVLTQGRLKPGWDFGEGVTMSGSSGGFSKCVDNLIAGVQSIGHPRRTGSVIQSPAQRSSLPEESASIWFTDPPYYDAVPYASLADFFFVWAKRVHADSHLILMRDPLDANNPLTPKKHEAIHDETQTFDGNPKDRAFFENTMGAAFKVGRSRLIQDGVGSVVFAHKTTEGWEALLSGMIHGGWTVTGSWPIATEMAHRLRARDSAALATSVHLVCRPRAEDAAVGEWADVLRELPERVGDWMQRLQGEGVRGADLVFACVGPALEIYSRYSAVEMADGRVVALPAYLERVWEVVGREALAQILGTAEARARNGAAGALEEDARLTALFLWTMQSTSEGTDSSGDELGDDDDADAVPRSGAHSLPFDVVRRFAQPLGIHLDEWESRIINTDKGVVRLIPVRDRGKQLFGDAGAGVLADELETAAAYDPQLSLFPEAAPTVHGRPRRRGAAGEMDDLDASPNATTLDRIHAAMLLQGSGRTQALRALLQAEQERGPDFLRLANALSALYPRGSDEKRLLDAMLLAAR